MQNSKMEKLPRTFRYIFVKFSSEVFSGGTLHPLGLQVLLEG